MPTRIRQINLSGLLAPRMAGLAALGQASENMGRAIGGGLASIGQSIDAGRDRKESARRFDLNRSDDLAAREESSRRFDAQQVMQQEDLLDRRAATSGLIDEAMSLSQDLQVRSTLGAPVDEKTHGRIKSIMDAVGGVGSAAALAGMKESNGGALPGEGDEDLPALEMRLAGGKAQLDAIDKVLTGLGPNAKKDPRAQKAYSDLLNGRIGLAARVNFDTLRHGEATKRGAQIERKRAVAEEVEARKADVQSIIEHGTKHSTPEKAAQVASLYLHSTGDRLADWKSALAELDPPRQGASRRTAAEQAQYEADYMAEAKRLGVPLTNRYLTDAEEGQATNVRRGAQGLPTAGVARDEMIQNREEGQQYRRGRDAQADGRYAAGIENREEGQEYQRGRDAVADARRDAKDAEGERARAENEQYRALNEVQQALNSEADRAAERKAAKGDITQEQKEAAYGSNRADRVAKLRLVGAVNLQRAYHAGNLNDHQRKEIETAYGGVPPAPGSTALPNGASRAVLSSPAPTQPAPAPAQPTPTQPAPAQPAPMAPVVIPDVQGTGKAAAEAAMRRIPVAQRTPQVWLQIKKRYCPGGT